MVRETTYSCSAGQPARKPAAAAQKASSKAAGVGMSVRARVVEVPKGDEGGIAGGRDEREETS